MGATKGGGVRNLEREGDDEVEVVLEGLRIHSIFL